MHEGEGEGEGEGEVPREKCRVSRPTVHCTVLQWMAVSLAISMEQGIMLAAMSNRSWT